jgi:hypothetical protein
LDTMQLGFDASVFGVLFIVLFAVCFGVLFVLSVSVRNASDVGRLSMLNLQTTRELFWGGVINVKTVTLSSMFTELSPEEYFRLFN